MIWCCEFCVWMCYNVASTHVFRDASLCHAGCCYAMATCCCGLCIIEPCLSIMFSFQGVSPLCHHNFQHWMSWLGWWWRVQQNVISMLNSRISWINRDLNAHCAFGVFLKACLLQRMFSIINKLSWLCHAWLLYALCVTANLPLTHAMHSLAICNLHPFEDRCFVACMWLVSGLLFSMLDDLHFPKHELRPASPLNLSI